MRGYASGRWGQLHYRAEGVGEDEGEGRPAVVLLHESPLSSQIWERVLPLLGRRARAVALDTPGYGLSDPPPAMADAATYAQELLGAVDALGIDRFAVCGSHTGVSFGLELARLAGARVTHAIWTGVPLMERQRALEWRDRIAQPLAVDDAGSHLAWLWQRYKYTPAYPVELANMAVAHSLAAPDRYWWGYHAALSHDPKPLLRSLEIPTLLLAGESDQLAFADEPTLALLPRGELHVIRGEERKVSWERPAEYAEALLGFVERGA